MAKWIFLSAYYKCSNITEYKQSKSIIRQALSNIWDINEQMIDIVVKKKHITTFEYNDISVKFKAKLWLNTFEITVEDKLLQMLKQGFFTKSKSIFSATFDYESYDICNICNIVQSLDKNIEIISDNMVNRNALRNSLKANDYQALNQLLKNGLNIAGFRIKPITNFLSNSSIKTIKQLWDNFHQTLDNGEKTTINDVDKKIFYEMCNLSSVLFNKKIFIEGLDKPIRA